MDAIDSAHYAPEVERATVSLAWHFPDKVLPPVLRHLNPEIHFTQPWCAEILDAVNFVWSELNQADWPSVIDCLRQQNKLRDAEQLSAINDIYAQAEHAHRATKDLIEYYIELLKDYALLRGPLPHHKRLPVLRFSGGCAVLKDNAGLKRPNSLDPDFIGRGKIAGHTYEVSLWTDYDTFKKPILKLRFKPIP